MFISISDSATGAPSLEHQIGNGRKTATQERRHIEEVGSQEEGAPLSSSSSKSSLSSPRIPSADYHYVHHHHYRIGSGGPGAIGSPEKVRDIQRRRRTSSDGIHWGRKTAAGSSCGTVVSAASNFPVSLSHLVKVAGAEGSHSRAFESQLLERTIASTPAKRMIRGTHSPGLRHASSERPHSVVVSSEVQSPVYFAGTSTRRSGAVQGRAVRSIGKAGTVQPGSRERSGSGVASPARGGSGRVPSVTRKNRSQKKGSGAISSGAPSREHVTSALQMEGIAVRRAPGWPPARQRPPFHLQHLRGAASELRDPLRPLPLSGSPLLSFDARLDNDPLARYFAKNSETTVDPRMLLVPSLSSLEVPVKAAAAADFARRRVSSGRRAAAFGEANDYDGLNCSRNIFFQSSGNHKISPKASSSCSKQCVAGTRNPPVMLLHGRPPPPHYQITGAAGSQGAPILATARPGLAATGHPLESLGRHGGWNPTGRPARKAPMLRSSRARKNHPVTGRRTQKRSRHVCSISDREYISDTEDISDYSGCYYYYREESASAPEIRALPHCRRRNSASAPAADPLRVPSAVQPTTADGEVVLLLLPPASGERPGPAAEGRSATAESVPGELEAASYYYYCQLADGVPSTQYVTRRYSHDLPASRRAPRRGAASARSTGCADLLGQKASPATWSGSDSIGQRSKQARVPGDRFVEGFFRGSPGSPVHSLEGVQAVHVDSVSDRSAHDRSIALVDDDNSRLPADQVPKRLDRRHAAPESVAAASNGSSVPRMVITTTSTRPAAAPPAALEVTDLGETEGVEGHDLDSIRCWSSHPENGVDVQRQTGERGSAETLPLGAFEPPVTEADLNGHRERDWLRQQRELLRREQEQLQRQRRQLSLDRQLLRNNQRQLQNAKLSSDSPGVEDDPHIRNGNLWGIPQVAVTNSPRILSGDNILLKPRQVASHPPSPRSPLLPAQAHYYSTPNSQTVNTTPAATTAKPSPRQTLYPRGNSLDAAATPSEKVHNSLWLGERVECEAAGEPAVTATSLNDTRAAIGGAALQSPMTVEQPVQDSFNAAAASLDDRGTMQRAEWRSRGSSTQQMNGQHPSGTSCSAAAPRVLIVRQESKATGLSSVSTATARAASIVDPSVEGAATGLPISESNLNMAAVAAGYDPDATAVAETAHAAGKPNQVGAGVLPQQLSFPVDILQGVFGEALLSATDRTGVRSSHDVGASIRSASWNTPRRQRIFQTPEKLKRPATQKRRITSNRWQQPDRHFLKDAGVETARLKRNSTTISILYSQRRRGAADDVKGATLRREERMIFPYSSNPDSAVCYRGYPVDGGKSMKSSQRWNWKVQLVGKPLGPPTEPLPQFPQQERLLLRGDQYEAIAPLALTANEAAYNSGVQYLEESLFRQRRRRQSKSPKSAIRRHQNGIRQRGNSGTVNGIEMRTRGTGIRAKQRASRADAGARPRSSSLESDSSSPVISTSSSFQCDCRPTSVSFFTSGYARNSAIEVPKPFLESIYNAVVRGDGNHVGPKVSPP